MPDFEIFRATYNDINVLKPFMEQDKTTVILDKCVGISDNAELAVDSMEFEKLLYNKETAAQLHQIVITLSKDEPIYDIDVEGNTSVETVTVREIANDISEVINYLGFHHYMFVQDNGSDMSMYYIVNSVNYLSGRRSTNSNKLCRKISEFIDINYI